MFAGLVNTPVVSATELIKCRMQVQTENSSTAYYKNSWDCLVKVTTEEGPTKLFTGTVATAAREIPSIVGQFGAYYITKRLWTQYVQGGIPVSEINYSGCFFAGGVAGFVTWLVAYP